MSVSYSILTFSIILPNLTPWQSPWSFAVPSVLSQIIGGQWPKIRFRQADNVHLREPKGNHGKGPLDKRLVPRKNLLGIIRSRQLYLVLQRRLMLQLARHALDLGQHADDVEPEDLLDVRPGDAATEHLRHEYRQLRDVGNAGDGPWRAIEVGADPEVVVANPLRDVEDVVNNVVHIRGGGVRVGESRHQRDHEDAAVCAQPRKACVGDVARVSADAVPWSVWLAITICVGCR